MVIVNSTPEEDDGVNLYPAAEAASDVANTNHMTDVGPIQVVRTLYAGVRSTTGPWPGGEADSWHVATATGCTATNLDDVLAVQAH